MNYVKARADKEKGIVMETSDLLVATKLAIESMMSETDIVKYIPSWKVAAGDPNADLPGGARKEAAGFSKTQWRAKAHSRKCLVCAVCGYPPTANVPSSHGFRHCLHSLPRGYRGARV